MLKRHPRLLVAVAACGLSAAGCSTVTFLKSPDRLSTLEPVYESSRAAFFFSLVASDEQAYVNRICLGKDVDQMATLYTPSNILSWIFTAGIYSPRTIQIWCQL